MGPPDLHTSAAHIRDAFDDLKTAWLDVSQHWNDGVSRTFCENHLEPLGPLVKLALDALSNMSGQVNQMYRDCSE
jgi:hypothetical protein